MIAPIVREIIKEEKPIVINIDSFVKNVQCRIVESETDREKLRDTVLNEFNRVFEYNRSCVNSTGTNKAQQSNSSSPIDLP